MQANWKLIFNILVNPLLLVKGFKVICIKGIKAVLHIKDRLCLLLEWSLDRNGLLWNWLSKVLDWELRVHITWGVWIACYILLLHPLILIESRRLSTLIRDISWLYNLRRLVPIVRIVKILLLTLRVHLPYRILVRRLLPWLVLLLLVLALTPLIILWMATHYFINYIHSWL